MVVFICEKCRRKYGPDWPYSQCPYCEIKRLRADRQVLMDSTGQTGKIILALGKKVEQLQAKLTRWQDWAGKLDVGLVIDRALGEPPSGEGEVERLRAENILLKHHLGACPKPTIKELDASLAAAEAVKGANDGR